MESLPHDSVASHLSAAAKRQLLRNLRLGILCSHVPLLNSRLTEVWSVDCGVYNFLSEV